MSASSRLDLPGLPGGRPRAGRAGLLTVVLVVAALGTGVVEGQGDLWLDGPDAVQPGVDRQFPAVAVDPSGRALVVWDAFSAGVPRNDVYLRRFTPSGVPLGDPAIVNTFTADDQRNPRVAVAADGSFLVVWRSEEPGPVPTDPTGHWVRCRLFSGDGAPVGSDRFVSTLDAAIPGGDLRVDVAALHGGGFVVVWRSAAGGTDPGVGILARLVSAAGVPTGDPFQVNVEESQSQHHSAVAAVADGGFVVVWTVPGVSVRAFGANGAPRGGQLDVNQSTANGLATAIAVAPDGRLAVVWQEGGSRILARLYDSSLAPLGGEFLVSDLADTDPDAPRVAPYGEVGFLVVWESWTGVGTDLSSQSVQGRVVTGVDQFEGPQVQLNAFEPGSQHEPDVGAWGFEVALAWHSAGGNPAEPTDDSILGRLLGVCGLFCDDFEAGATQAWSSTVR